MVTKNVPDYSGLIGQDDRRSSTRAIKIGGVLRTWNSETVVPPALHTVLFRLSPLCAGVT